jgi:hypothetical protein
MTCNIPALLAAVYYLTSLSCVAVGNAVDCVCPCEHGTPIDLHISDIMLGHNYPEEEDK